MVTDAWIGQSGGSFEDAQNWSDSQQHHNVPSRGDVAQIAQGSGVIDLGDASVEEFDVGSQFDGVVSAGVLGATVLQGNFTAQLSELLNGGPQLTLQGGTFHGGETFLGGNVTVAESLIASSLVVSGAGTVLLSSAFIDADSLEQGTQLDVVSSQVNVFGAYTIGIGPGGPNATSTTIDTSSTLAVHGAVDIVGSVVSVQGSSFVEATGLTLDNHATLTVSNGSDWLDPSTDSNGLAIGASVGAELDLRSGGVIAAGGGAVGGAGTSASATGIINVDGFTSRLDLQSSFIVGNGGYGYVNLTNNGALSSTAALTLAETGTGQLFIDAFSRASFALLVVGDFGQASFTDNGTFSAQSLTVGRLTGAGVLTVTGAQAHGTITNGATIGVYGAAAFTVSAAATVAVMGTLAVADQSGNTGADRVTVTDAGSRLTVDTLAVGRHGTGSLNVASGGTLAVGTGATGEVDLGSTTRGTGKLTVTGTASMLSTPTLAIGGTAANAGGHGNLALSSGGVATVSGGGTVYAGGTVSLLGGTLTAQALSISSAANPLMAGTLRDQLLTLTSQGRLFGSGTIVGTGSRPSIANGGTIEATLGTLTVGEDVTGTGSLLVGTSGTLSLGGMVGVGQSVQFEGESGTLVISAPDTMAGTITHITEASRIVIDLPSVTADSAVISNDRLVVLNHLVPVASFATGDIDDMAMFLVTPDGHGGSQITVNTPAGTPGPAGLPITIDVPSTLSVVAGDTTPISPAFVSDPNADSSTTVTVTLLDTLGGLTASALSGGMVNTANGGHSLTVVGSPDQVNAALSTLAYASRVTGSDTISVGVQDPFGDAASAQIAVTVAAACYAAGTRILTERGLVPIEALRIGEGVITHSGTIRRIQWLGHRTVACLHHPRPAEVMPIRIRAGAFAPGCPVRDMLLSPDHAILADDVLIPVRCLTDGVKIAQEAVDRIVYWHVELDRHDVIPTVLMPDSVGIPKGLRV